MRVIAGLYRHRQLLMPKSKEIRPTKDLVKESMFNIISNRIHNEAIVLDLFAGSGSLGIEALSRGAKFAYFVDKNLKAISTIKQNIYNLKITNTAIFNMHYLSAIKKFNEKQILFDIILIDPPYIYNSDEYLNIICYIKKYKILNKKAIIILESNCQIKINTKNFKVYKYGKTYVTIIYD